MKRLNRVFLLCGVMAQGLAFASGATAAPTASVTLAWDPSPGPSIAGYRVYQGVASLTYTNVTNVGTATKATLSGLTPGVSYFFAVTAYATNSLESPLSGEIAYTVPSATVTTLQLRVSPTRQAVLTGTGPAGYTYDLQATKDSVTWSKLSSVTNKSSGTFQYTDPTPATDTVRYYRLRQTSP